MSSTLHRFRHRPGLLALHLSLVLLWPLAAGAVADSLQAGPLVAWVLLVGPLLLTALALYGVWSRHERRRVDVLRRRFSSLAHRDALTGIANRRALDARLRDAESRRERAGVGVHLMVIDLDDFKEINDSHGHAVGDEVLRAVARRLDGLVRGSDFVARTGGDEFVVVLELTGSSDGVSLFEQRLRRALKKPIRTQAGAIRVGFSLGIAEARAERPLEEAVSAADSAMYRDKNDT